MICVKGLNKKDYVEQILERFNLDKAKVVSTPAVRKTWSEKRLKTVGAEALAVFPGFALHSVFIILFGLHRPSGEVAALIPSIYF